MGLLRGGGFRVAFGVVALMLVVLGVGAGCASSLILPPVPREAAVSSGTRRRSFVRDGMKLEAFVARSSGCAGREPTGYVLRFTGGDASGAAAFTAGRWAAR